MAVVVRGIAVLLAVAAVSNAETFKESLYTDEVSPSNLNQTAISEELALQDPEKDGEDFTEDSGDAAFQKKENEINQQSDPLFGKRKKCGERKYNPTFKKCCYGKVIFRLSRCVTPRYCGSKQYNPRSRGCCGGKVYSKFTKRCCNNRPLLKFIPCIKQKKCGYQLYKPFIQQCCFGKVISRFIKCYSPRCGYQRYNPLIQGCCAYRVVYSTLYQQCCRSRVIHKFQRCY